MTTFSPGEKRELLHGYYAHCRKQVGSLTVKLPREAQSALLDEIGLSLLATCKAAATQPGLLRDFLAANELPPMLRGLLPDEFRAYCLILNALKQWVAKQSAKTDQYLLGGAARTYCREAATECMLCGQTFGDRTPELHHALRDGRPPIPLCEICHREADEQERSYDDPIFGQLLPLKRKGHHSWVQLRLGCESHLGLPLSAAKPQAVIGSAKTFAKQAAELTGMSCEQLLVWLNQLGLGVGEDPS